MKGHGDFVSILVTPIGHLVSPVISTIKLTESPAKGFMVQGFVQALNPYAPQPVNFD